jgi:hypothetical protein
MAATFSRQDVIYAALILAGVTRPGEVIQRTEYLHLETLAQAMGVPDTVSGAYLQARKDLAILIRQIYFGPKFSLWDRLKIWLKGNIWLTNRSYTK